MLFNTSIINVLDIIKDQTGIGLVLCNHFTGIQYFNKDPYFNVLLSEKIPESSEYEELYRFANQYNIIRIQPNGLKRVSIFF